MTSSQMFICRNVTFLQALGVEWKVTSNVSTDLMFDINKESLSLLYRLQWFAIGVGGGGGDQSPVAMVLYVYEVLCCA